MNIPVIKVVTEEIDILRGRDPLQAQGINGLP
jgi:hypothetical protein